MCTKTFFFLLSTPEALLPAGGKPAVGTACDFRAKPLAKFSHAACSLDPFLLSSCFCFCDFPPLALSAQPQRGRDPVELLCAGCYVELQDGVDPALAWAAEVEENVGGRLKLRLLGTQGLPDTPATLWLFYLHPRLHPPGWAKEHGCTLRPPAGQCCRCRVGALYLETQRGGTEKHKSVRQSSSRR